MVKITTTLIKTKRLKQYTGIIINDVNVNLKCARVNRYFAIEPIDFKSAHAQTIICTRYLQLTYYSHQLFVGKLANQR